MNIKKEAGNELNFSCQMVCETKVADTIEVGQEFVVNTLFRPVMFRVESIDEEAGKATMVSSSGNLYGFLEKREDGWYDQHIHGNLNAIKKLSFDP